MSALVVAVATRVYCACVDFELRLAKLVSITYRDVNAGLFFVIFPLVTLALMWLVAHQRAVIERLERGQASSDEGSVPPG